MEFSNIRAIAPADGSRDLIRVDADMTRAGRDYSVTLHIEADRGADDIGAFGDGGRLVIFGATSRAEIIAGLIQECAGLIAATVPREFNVRRAGRDEGAYLARNVSDHVIRRQAAKVTADSFDRDWPGASRQAARDYFRAELFRAAFK